MRGISPVLLTKRDTWYIQGEEKSLAGQNGAAIAPATARITVSDEWKHSVRKEAETDNRGKQKPDLSWRKTSAECGNPAFYSIVSICKMAGKRNSRICRLSWGFSWESIHRQRSECYSNSCFKSRQKHTGFCTDLCKSRQGNSGQRAKNTESLIDAIGSSERDITYTKECEQKIQAARKAYDALGKGSVAYQNVNGEKTKFLETAKLLTKN